MKFENTRVFRLNFKNFKQGSAVTIPGIGIFIGNGFEKDLNLLRHEFGHLLQFQKWGFFFFWKNIASTSLKSARFSRKKHFQHQQTWTEWSANWLSFHYFDLPADWDFERFPITPEKETAYSKPKFSENNEDFFNQWVLSDKI